MRQALGHALAGIALAVFVVAVSFGSVRADTGDDEEFVCPLCTKTFEAFVAHSGTSFGSRLDFKAVGPIYSPWPVPRCTHCGFVIYDDELDEAQKVKLRAFVAGDTYAPVWKKHTNHYCMGLIRAACEKVPPMGLGTCFLKATWELGDDDKRYATYATTAIGYFAKVPAPAAELTGEEAERAREDHLVAQYLQVELHRRSGALDAAQDVLNEIAKLDRAGAPDWYERAVAFQAALIAKQDQAPHTFSELPPEEEEEPKDDEPKDDEPEGEQPKSEPKPDTDGE